MMKRTFIFIGILSICLTGCQTRYSCPKERSYFTAMRILQTDDEETVIDKIKACDDIDALRIIVFAARATAWPMEAGPDVKFDNKMDGIFQIAMQRLFALDPEEANASIECYRRAFPPDGAYALFFEEWEEERRALRSKRNGNAKESSSAIISPESNKP